MIGRVVIITIGAGFAVYCVVFSLLTVFGKNPATLHLTKYFSIGYAAVNAVLTPFGIAGVIGGISRKKSLIRAFAQIQWWLATFVLIGLNVLNIVLSKNGKGDFIRRCQSDLAKGQAESEFLGRCTAIADNAERAAFIYACVQSGIMLFFAIILLIVGIREYSNISLEEETKVLLEKGNANGNDNNYGNTSVENTPDSHELSYSPASVEDAPDSHELRYSPASVEDAPDSHELRYSSTTNVELTRHPTNANTMNAAGYSGLRRHQTDSSTMSSRAAIGRNQTENNFIPQQYKGLARNPTIPGNISPERYLTNGYVNVTRQPTIENAYTLRNYVETPQAAYPIQRSLSTKHYINQSNQPPHSFASKSIIPPPQQTLVNIAPKSEVDIYDYSNGYSSDYNSYYPFTKTIPTHQTRMERY